MDFDKKKKRRGFSNFLGEDEVFENIDKVFERMHEDMLQQMERMRSARLQLDEKEIKRLSQDPNVKVYGYSLRVGPDGKPHFREFGNVKRPENIETMQESSREKEGTEEGTRESGEREPLVNVFSTNGKTTVVAELPGVLEKDISISLKGKTLKIKVDKGDRKYFKKLELPKKSSKSKMKQKYNNGVLELTFS